MMFYKDGQAVMMTSGPEHDRSSEIVQVRLLANNTYAVGEYRFDEYGFVLPRPETEEGYRSIRALSPDEEQPE